MGIAAQALGLKLQVFNTRDLADLEGALSNLDAEELGGKQIELLKEAVPKLSRVAVLRHTALRDDAARRQIEAAARALKLEVKDFSVSHAKDLASTFAAMSQARVGALLVRRDPAVIEPNRAEVVALAASRRLPALYSFRQFPDSGGLMSYGSNVYDIHRRSATYVDISKHAGRVNDESILVDEIAA